MQRLADLDQEESLAAFPDLIHVEEDVEIGSILKRWLKFRNEFKIDETQFIGKTQQDTTTTTQHNNLPYASLGQHASTLPVNWQDFSQPLRETM